MPLHHNMPRLSLPSRPWNGFSAWIIPFLSSIAIFELLAALAWKNEHSRLADPTTLFIIIPCGAIMIALSLAWLLARTGSLSFGSALMLCNRFSPIAWAIPIFDIIRSYGNGITITASTINGIGLLESIGTGGLLPFSSTLTAGMRLGMLFTVAGCAMIIWSISRKITRTIFSGLLMSIVVTCIVHAQAFFVFIHAPFSSNAWTASSMTVGRQAVLLFSQGFWWGNPYERFPGALDADTDIALRMMSSAWMILLIGILLLIAAMTILPSAKRIAKSLFTAWSLAEVFLFTALGIIFGRISDGIVAFSDSILAWIVLIFCLLCIYIASSLRDVISGMEEAERAGTAHLIADGVLPMERARSLASALDWLAIAASWTLGWPICASLLITLSAKRLLRDRTWGMQLWSRIAFRGMSVAGLALAGNFFILRSADLGQSALVSCGASLLAMALIEGVWMTRVRKIEKGL